MYEEEEKKQFPVHVDNDPDIFTGHSNTDKWQVYFICDCKDRNGKDVTVYAQVEDPCEGKKATKLFWKVLPRFLEEAEDLNVDFAVFDWTEVVKEYYRYYLLPSERQMKKWEKAQRKRQKKLAEQAEQAEQEE